MVARRTGVLGSLVTIWVGMVARWTGIIARMTCLIARVTRVEFWGLGYTRVRIGMVARVQGMVARPALLQLVCHLVTAMK
jgi:hypothetical protein